MAFTISAAGSLALGAAVAAGWARSYAAAEVFAAGYWNFGPHPGTPGYQDASEFVAIHQGGTWTAAVVRRACVAGPGFRRAGPGEDHGRWRYDRDDAERLETAEDHAWGGRRPPPETLGFRRGVGRRHQTVGFPDWALVAGCALLPTCWAFGAARARRRRRAGQCARCGYDLRASPGHCPECGAANRSTSKLPGV
jgi:hypothetical protein